MAQLIDLQSPWKIVDTQLDVSEQPLEITIEWRADQRVPCPKCGITVALSAIPGYVRGSIPDVAMDMEATSEKACTLMMPEEEFVYDKSRIDKLLSPAMHKVHRKEHSRLISSGVPVFIKGRYLVLKRPERCSVLQREQFRVIKREYVERRFSCSRLDRARAITQAVRALWTYMCPDVAIRYFQRQYCWNTHGRLRPLFEAARMMRSSPPG